jgi:DNA helicase-2/ATP-dependent DNA helicase PcrA
MPDVIPSLPGEENFSSSFSRLNEAQRKAVQTIEGPVLVIAGPGTGKTQIIATRIAYILSTTDAQVQPHNILCLTYTEAGAVAMRKRLLAMIGTAAHRITIETFHAFCNTVIRQNLEHFGHRELELVSDLERYALLEEIINELDASHPLKRLKGEGYYEAQRLEKLFSLMKQEDWSPARISEAAGAYLADLPNRDEYRYKKNTKDNKKGDLKENNLAEQKDKMNLLKAAAALFPVYEAKLKERRRYDYHDMILWVIAAFRNNENLLRNYQERYQYVLVDEFQDTNGAQNEIIHLLTNYWEAPNIFCVGDDDQGIYEFQGARIQNIEDFLRRYQHSLTTVVLSENYRSTQSILDTAKRVIDHNTLRLAKSGSATEKTLHAALPERRSILSPPQVHEYANDWQEVAGITRRILSLREKGTPLREIAVLYYRHAQAATLIELFGKKAIPFNVIRNVNLLDLPEAGQLLTIFRYLDAELRRPYLNDALLFEIMHYRWFALDPADVATVSFFANSLKQPQPWLLLMKDEKFLSSIPLADAEGIRRFQKMVEGWLREAKGLTLPMLLEKIVNESGYLQWVLRSEDKAWNLQVLHTLFDFVKNEALKNPALSLTSLLNMTEQMQTHGLRLEVMKVTADEEGVVFSTCHSAKGLEFEHVFLMGCSDAGWEKAGAGGKTYQLPDTLTLTTEENKTESLRRLFYVGITRAKISATISYAVENSKGKEKVASQFVTETGLGAEKILVPDEMMAEILGDFLREAPKPVAARLEKALVEKRLQHFALSPSSLNAYLDCPIRFYYENIVRIPQAANDSMAFGSAVHYALQRLFEKMKANGEKFPPAETLVSDFVSFMHRNKSSFTEKQFENRLNLGRQLLPEFYAYYLPRWNKVVALEFFVREVEMNGIPLKGKLDKIEFDGNSVTVVDYKTGSLANARQKGKLSPPGEKNPLGGDYWRQLVFYKILLDHQRSKNWRMEKGVIDFIEQDQKTKQFHQFPLAVSPEYLSIVRDQITDTYRRIQNHEFYEGCGKEDCNWCTFVRQNLTGEIPSAEE